MPELISVRYRYRQVRVMFVLLGIQTEDHSYQWVRIFVLARHGSSFQSPILFGYVSSSLFRPNPFLIQETTPYGNPADQSVIKCISIHCILLTKKYQQQSAIVSPSSWIFDHSTRSSLAALGRGQGFRNMLLH